MLTQQEMTDLVYDKLMDNCQHPLFDTSGVVCPEVKRKEGSIKFTYYGVDVDILIRVH
ncbi:hypothetical protein LCGC14_1904780 [marine sediment metagenome]|uniref:Uncharacterized protein n=1 Tax=marine sediment metagenome TaxID=412755 RepID=A0A0F9ITL9_9ZZZZ